MGTLVPRYTGLASCRTAELRRRRRQLRHAVAAGVDEVHERLPVYSFPLSWAFYCNPGLVPEYNITEPISLLVNLRSSSRPVFPFHLATACCAASAVPSHSVCRPRVLPCLHCPCTSGARHILFWRLVWEVASSKLAREGHWLRRSLSSCQSLSVVVFIV